MSRTGPASFAHERLYFVDRLQPGHAGYVVALALRLRGALDVAALRLALTDLVARHDALRTTFALRDGALIQRIAEPDAAVAEVDVVSRTPADEPAREAYLWRLVGEGARRPFPLATGPLLRATIVSWSPSAHGLALLVHHIACDGWSVGILLRDLAARYDARVAAGAGAGVAGAGVAGVGVAGVGGLAPAPSYLDYTLAQRAQWADGDDDALAFWRDALAGAPPLALPADRPRPAVLSDRGGVLRVPLGDASVAALTEWSVNHGVTLFATVLAAYVSVLVSATGQDDVVVGVPVANRLDDDEETLVGCLVNTLPLRIDAAGAPSLRELARRVRDVTLSALAYQHVPFERIVAAVDGQRGPGRAPLFQTSFGLQNFPFAQPEFAGLDVTEVGVEIDAAKFDLGLSVDVSADVPFVRAEYSTDLFDAGTVTALVNRYVDLLRALAGGETPAAPTAVPRGPVPRGPVPHTGAGGRSGREPDRPEPAPGEQTERIRLIWVDVLGRPDLGVDDNFFDLGGTSLRMIALQQAMGEAGFELALVDLFRCGTVAACARQLAPAHPPAHPPADAPAETVEALAARRGDAVRGLAERRRVTTGRRP